MISLLKEFFVALMLVGIAFSSVAQTQKTAKKIKSSITAKEEKTAVKFKVSGSVHQTFQYCGGTAPTEEILREYQNPKPYSGKKFYVKKGTFNEKNESAILSFIADTNGHFSFEITPGTYCILIETQMKTMRAEDYNKQGFISADKDCLMKWWRMPYHLLEVTSKDIQGLDFNFHHRCFVPEDIPCLIYEGPLPP